MPASSGKRDPQEQFSRTPSASDITYVSENFLGGEGVVLYTIHL